MVVRILLAIFFSAALAGCDGNIGFRDVAGVLEHTSGRNLIRGFADGLGQINEDEAKTKNRRDIFEATAERQGLNLSDNLGGIIKNNLFYKNVVFINPDENIRNMPGYHVLVNFDIDGGYHVQFDFLIQQMTMLGFFHLTKLPIFSKGIIKHEDATLPIASEDLFLLALKKDEGALKLEAEKLLGTIRAQKIAEADALAKSKQASCEGKIDDQIHKLKFDPYLSEVEKQESINKIQDDKNKLIEECISQ